jgi:hypothetical protein
MSELVECHCGEPATTECSACGLEICLFHCYDSDGNRWEERTGGLCGDCVVDIQAHFGPEDDLVFKELMRELKRGH